MPALTPFGRAALPSFRGWVAVLGPGVVWMALAQGSAELIWWPYLIAKYGLGFLVLLLPACLLQWPLTFEVGRYTALTGEGIWRGFIRLHPWFAIPLWALMLVSFAWFGAFAAAGGTALAALTGFPPGLEPRGQALAWGYLTIGVFLVALLLAPVLYRFIERFMLVVAVVTVVGLVMACSHESVLVKVPVFLRGLVGVEHTLLRPWEPRDASTLLTAIVFAGLGGFWTLFYSYWVKEKGVGMAWGGSHITGLLNREVACGQAGQAPIEAPAGNVPEDTPEAAYDGRRWMRFLALDSGIGIFGNILTTLLTCLLTYVLLTPKGLLPQGWDLAVVQSEFFALRWGMAGRALYLIVAAAFLTDSWLTTADAVARVNTDVLLCMSPRARRLGERYWYFVFVGALAAVTCATMPLAPPGPLIILSALLGFLGTVIFSTAILVLNYRILARQLPKALRPSWAACLSLGISCIVYFGLALVYVWIELSGG